MPRKHVPAAVKKAEGTYREDRHGPYNHPIDDISGSPDVPCGLGTEGEEIFKFVCDQYEGIPGVLAPMDKYQLEFMCRWLIKARVLTIQMEAEDEDEERCIKLERRAKQAYETFDKIAKQFGLSPTARAALRAGTQGAGHEDPLDEFGIT